MLAPIPASYPCFEVGSGISTNVRNIHHLDLISLKPLFSIRKKFTFRMRLQKASLKISEVTVS